MKNNRTETDEERQRKAEIGGLASSSTTLKAAFMENVNADQLSSEDLRQQRKVAESAWSGAHAHPINARRPNWTR